VALSKHIATLLRDPDLRARMGAAGRAAVEKRLGAPAMARRVEEVYHVLLSRARRPAPTAAEASIAR
jgi:glycosyltransferase involved in cell wall biosynthesis